MKTSPLHQKVQAAMEVTQARTPARSKALAAIQWRLREACGLYISMKNFQTALVEKSEATVFDGRDNEALKIKFFEATTGGNYTVELA